MTSSMSRRDFIRGTAAAVLGASAAFGQSPASPAKKTRVVLIRHPDALDADSAFNEPVIQQMLDEAVSKLLDLSDPVEAFKRLVKPEDIVGIKTNVWSFLPTPAAVEKAIKRRVLDAGVEEKNIGLDDHTVRTNPLFVKATALINARPVRTHYPGRNVGLPEELHHVRRIPAGLSPRQLRRARVALPPAAGQGKDPSQRPLRLDPAISRPRPAQFQPPLRLEL